MSQSGRFYSFLSEMLLILLFFSISAAVLLRMFVRAEEESRQTALRTAALISAQSMLEESAADGKDRSRTFGLDGGEYTVTTVVKDEHKGTGVLRRVIVTAEGPKGEQLLTVPMETAVFSEELI